MKKPIKPKKPRKPTEFYDHTLVADCHQYQTIKDLVDDFTKKIAVITPDDPLDLSRIIIEDDIGYEYNEYRFKYISKMKKMPEVYQQDLENFKIKNKQYKEKYKIFKDEMDKYIKFVESEDLKKKRRLLKELKEELENVGDTQD